MMRVPIPTWELDVMDAMRKQKENFRREKNALMGIGQCNKRSKPRRLNRRVRGSQSHGM